MRFFNLSTSEGKVFWIVIAAIVIVSAAKIIEPAVLTEEEAYKIAITNEQCKDELTTSIFYNEDTKTWWIDLSIEREGCAPACVVSERTRTAEINWRCTGLVE